MFDTHLTTAIASLWRLERFSQPHKAATNAATNDDKVGAGFGDVNVGDGRSYSFK